ncbi:NAD(+) synthase [Marinovum sp.]|uniref:NAD(+) synthase n=1 Tax=Marinovum sp. TaxID=2024839 RepID=UPI003A95B516
MTQDNAAAFAAFHRHGFIRVATCTPRVRPADVAFNCESVIEEARAADRARADLLVCPELCLSSYAIDDLHMQEALLAEVEAAVARVTEASAELSPVILVGAPLRHEARLYNCAVVISRGKVLGVVPKSYLPNYREFYEKRWFAHGRGIRGEITVAGARVPFGDDLIFEASDLPGLIFHAEICEDLWTPAPPSSNAAMAGALILANLSASNIVIGKSTDRHSLCQSQSMRGFAAYVYSAAGPGESTTDLAWDGQGMIYELGDLLAESTRFPTEPELTLADVDAGRIRSERMRTGSFNDAARHHAPEFRQIRFDHLPHHENAGLIRPLRRFPYVPNRESHLDQDCYEAFNIQVEGLRRRFEATHGKTMVIGISGGLDSTHALIVAAKACDRMGLPRERILAFTMPGFATSDHTKDNAWKLMRAMGVSADEIDIRPAARQMLSDMGHPFSDGEPVYDITFENVQAGLRTDYLFRLANQRQGFVIGTGDLSELALGWCTYGVGDQMSHYAVNAGVPKTLIQYLIRWTTRTGQFDAETDRVLEAILETEISPELVPAGEDEEIQSTESMIGPYELNDFFLYHTMRYGHAPSKVAFLAWHAWHDVSEGRWPEGFPEAKRNAYDLETIRHWLEKFLFRFFATSQFKRSALPNGPKVSPGGALSPRGDWRAPSDSVATPWLKELRDNVPETWPEI